MFRLSQFIQTQQEPLSRTEYKLAFILGIAPGELSSILMGRVYYYRPFSIPKRDGRERRILAPSPALKKLQRRLLCEYLSQQSIHPAATAFFPGASIVSNAQRHAGQDLIATVDLADFFSSTSADRVRAFFLRQGWRGPSLTTLMRLCVYQNGLPQGAPTSPCLSNLVNYELDQTLSELARRSGAAYTRYGDDLFFSWSARRIPSGFKAAVHRQIFQAGYQIQPRKRWQVHRAAQEPEVTGLVLGRDGNLREPRRVRREVRRLRWRLWWRENEVDRERLRGYEGFLHSLGG